MREAVENYYPCRYASECLLATCHNQVRVESSGTWLVRNTGVPNSLTNYLPKCLSYTKPQSIRHGSVTAKRKPLVKLIDMNWMGAILLVMQHVERTWGLKIEHRSKEDDCVENIRLVGKMKKRLKSTVNWLGHLLFTKRIDCNCNQTHCLVLRSNVLLFWWADYSSCFLALAMPSFHFLSYLLSVSQTTCKTERNMTWQNGVEWSGKFKNTEKALNFVECHWIEWECKGKAI